MADFPPLVPLVNDGCRKLIPHFLDDIVESIARECAALVLDDPSLLATNLTLMKEDIKNESECRALNVKENGDSLFFNDWGEVKASGQSRRGTGVFIPRMDIINKKPFIPRMDIINKKPSSPPMHTMRRMEIINKRSPMAPMAPMRTMRPVPQKGTRAFIAPPVPKNKTSRNNGQNMEKSCATKDEGLKMNEPSQVPLDIVLPQEWPY